MIGIYNTITIDNVEFIRPSNFQLSREDIYQAEYQTCTGKTIADRVGWKYSDMELAWDTLPDDKMAVLTGLDGAVELAFTDSDGAQTENVMRLGFANTPTRHTLYDGTVIWKDVRIKLRFIDAHGN